MVVIFPLSPPLMDPCPHPLKHRNQDQQKNQGPALGVIAGTGEALRWLQGHVVELGSGIEGGGKHDGGEHAWV